MGDDRPAAAPGGGLGALALSVRSLLDGFGIGAGLALSRASARWCWSPW
jgi:hypothetical protein